MKLALRKSLVRGALLAGTIGAASVAAIEVGCSSNGPQEPGGAGPAAGDTGTVGMRLTLPGGQQVSTITWTLTGPGGASTVVQTGTANVQNSDTISFLIGGIAPGNGYAIALSGTSTDGSVTCGGSAQFNVAARATTDVSIALQCNVPPSEAGYAAVTGAIYGCASVGSLAASPAETTVGHSVAVTGSATGPTPGAFTYAWSASSGSFDTPNAASANFTCTTAGPATLTLTVGDGPVVEGGTCDAGLSAQSFQIQCDAVVTDGGTSG